MPSIANALRVGLLAGLCAAATSADEPRQVIPLDTGWRFHRGDLPTSALGKPITAWRWKAGEDHEDLKTDRPEAAPDLDATGPGWQDAAPGQDVFRGRRGFAWFRAILPASTSTRPMLSFEGVDDNASVYLNGKILARHEGWNSAFEVPLDTAWRSEGRNVLAVLVENTNGAGGIGPATLEDAAGGAGKADGPLLAGYDDSSWRRVDVPHDFIVEGTFDRKADAGHGSLPAEPGWYRKTIAIPDAAKGRQIWIEFDGIYRASRMWLNGRPLGRHESGYTGSRYDITEAVRFGGEDLLAVRVDPSRWEGWWYDGGGIYRHVRLVTLDPVHIAPWGVFVTSDVPDPGDGARAEAVVTAVTTLANESAAVVGTTLDSEVVDADGRVVAEARDKPRLLAIGSAEVTQKLPFKGAHLWSVEKPYLYRLRSTVLVGDKAVDRIETTFGVRTIRFDAERGFFLNGKPVKIKGTCNHQDFAGVGSALPDRIHVFRLEKLKEMGANGYRCSHHPHSPVVLDACDRLGILVMDENRRLGDSPEILSQVESMVLRDRNHPSVVLWSLCNEEGEQGSEKGAAQGRAMMGVIRRLDPTRPVTAAMNGGYGSGLTGVVDVVGFNYHIGDYDRLHQKFPGKPLIGSETASAVGTRGIYALEKFSNGSGSFLGDRERGYVAAYDVNAPNWAQLAEVAWRAVADRPFMAGCFAWTGFDYKGEPTPFGWPCVNSHFGIMDICGFPKDGFWYYQSWWSDRPVLHVFPHWNWPGKEGQEIDVWCYSNCGRVELYLNGASQGAREMEPNGHLAWKVKYQPGVLSARGTRDGKELTAQVETTGAPAGIELAPDRTTLAADGADVSLVTVRIVDDKGRTVPAAADEVTFEVKGQGKLLGVGNGDPASHEPDKASKRRAFGGLCLALVQAGEKAGTIELAATSPGLKPASVVIRSEAPER